MKTPPEKNTLSDIQRAAMALLSKTLELSGRDMREQLDRDGVRCSGPAFYGDMAKLEDRGYVRGWDEAKVIEGETVKERYYQLTL